MKIFLRKMKHTSIGKLDYFLGDFEISKELGMDPDEVLRLTQIGGLAEAFADRSFSMAWDVVDETDDLVDADVE